MKRLQTAYQGLPFGLCPLPAPARTITSNLVIDQSLPRLLLINEVSNKVTDCILPS